MKKYRNNNGNNLFQIKIMKKKGIIIAIVAILGLTSLKLYKK